ncbi:DUF2637 domain-containing protein [Cellulomonas sp. JH27-2]|uniref:DUF2637 domain-containing protein n=1 Tax=Cellulomonas sp. JH27-2 TaxID=2774139 RepID=UPI00177ABD6A|nr:DUF2637 domain-containing protein [Cellulomonas sp. JH27-2]MBD8057845.1 DUF2637 domain-containing protein [Cellulomonas sp. JH27-2]
MSTTKPAPKRPAKATRHGSPISRMTRSAALGLTVVIASASMVLSYVAITALAAMSGVPASIAWLVPVVLDGLTIAATVAVVALAEHERRDLVYPWSVLGAAAVASIAANMTHAALTYQGTAGAPRVVSLTVAAVPPVTLLLSTHLTVSLTRQARPAKPKTTNALTLAAIAPAAEQSTPIEANANLTPGLHAVEKPAKSVAAKVTAELYDEVLALSEGGASWSAVAEQTGVSRSQVGRIVRGEKARPAA